MGANNYLASPEEEDRAVEEVILGIKHSVQRLVDAGASTILLLNLPDLGAVPYAKLVDQEALLTRYAIHHNTRLQETFDELKNANSKVTFVYYDIFSIFNDAVMHPEKYGFTNVTSPCYESFIPQVIKKQPHSMLKIASGIDIRSMQGEQCRGYFFFDLVHPVGLAHKIIAEEVKHQLDAAGVSFTG